MKFITINSEFETECFWAILMATLIIFVLYFTIFVNTKESMFARIFADMGLCIFVVYLITTWNRNLVWGKVALLFSAGVIIVIKNWKSNEDNTDTHR